MSHVYFSVSVIIPVYNAAPFVAKAVESALMLPEIAEVLLIEDGSHDDSMEVCKQLVRDNEKVKLFTHANNKNKGAGASRNVGIKNAQYEFIAFLDADDFYLPNRFFKDKEIFSQYPDAAGCYNALGTHFYSEAAKKVFMKHFYGRTTTSVFADANPSPETLFEGILGFRGDHGYFHMDCLTIKREELLKNNLFFNEVLKLHQDTDLILKLSYHCRLYPSEISELTAMRGIHEKNRITANYEQDKKRQFRNQFLLWESLYKWGRKNKIKNNIALKHFKKNMDYYKMMSNENPNPLALLIELICNRKLLKHDNYREIHRLYTKTLGDKISFALLRIRNILVKRFV